MVTQTNTPTGIALREPKKCAPTAEERLFNHETIIWSHFQSTGRQTQLERCPSRSLGQQLSAHALSP